MIKDEELLAGLAFLRTYAHPAYGDALAHAEASCRWICGRWIGPQPVVEEDKQAAVAMIEDDNDRILCVWNRRYNGWSMPGGLREPGETIGQALSRELGEETGLEVASAIEVFSGEHGIETAHKRGRASRVVLFRVIARGEPEAKEAGCPIAWKTRKEFLAESPFASFYGRVFAKVPTRSAIIIEDLNRARIEANERANLAEHKLKSLEEQIANAHKEIAAERERTIAALKAWAEGAGLAGLIDAVAELAP